MLILLIIFTIILLINIYRRYLSKATLILIEGLDCSGKKTLAYSIQKFYRDKYKVRVNVGPLLKSPLSEISNKFTYNWDLPNSVRSIVYALSYIIDGLFFIPRRKEIILQVSYLPRHIAYNTVDNKKYINIIHAALSPLYVKFNQAVYLHANLETRISRHKNFFTKKVEIQDINSRFMINEEGKYSLWEKETLNLTERLYGSVLIINSTGKTPESIFKIFYSSHPIL